MVGSIQEEVAGLERHCLLAREDPGQALEQGFR